MKTNEIISAGRFCLVPLAALNPPHCPVIDTDFWRWLDDGHYIEQKSINIGGYLAQRKGHYKTEEDMYLLKLIHEHYAFMLFRDFKFGPPHTLPEVLL